MQWGKPDNWNAPIVGENVGVCLINGPNTAPGLRAASSSWIWEKSANGDTWTAISGNTSATYEYIPATADVGIYLRAKVELTDGSFAYTRILGGRVKSASASADATQGAAATFVSGNTIPRVGVDVIANNPAPSGAVDTYYGWQRCPNTITPHTDCVFITANWIEYTPVAADAGNYLRMYVYYATSAGVWTRHETGFTGQVAASQ